MYEANQTLDSIGDALAAMKSVAVALSGGVDSGLVALLARKALGEQAVAFTVAFWALPRHEIEAARNVAKVIGIRHEILEAGDGLRGIFLKNEPDRCYHCKKAILGVIQERARAEELAVLVDGSNADDEGDYRPGSRALREFGVRSPLREAGLGKRAIRAAAEQLGLPNWNAPSMACLASRFPYGVGVTLERAQRVDAAEAFLREKSFRIARVRYDGTTARIEVAQEDISRLAGADMRAAIVAALKRMGFDYVALDLQGYRTGSSNETLRGSST